MAAAAAATVATLGIAAAVEAAAIEIGKRIIREVIQEIEDVVIAELVWGRCPRKRIRRETREVPRGGHSAFRNRSRYLYVL